MGKHKPLPHPHVNIIFIAFHSRRRQKVFVVFESATYKFNEGEAFRSAQTYNSILLCPVFLNGIFAHHRIALVTRRSRKWMEVKRTEIFISMATNIQFQFQLQKNKILRELNKKQKSRKHRKILLFISKARVGYASGTKFFNQL